MSQPPCSPAAQPQAEVVTGLGLYWHLPGRCMSDPCLLPSCPTNLLPVWYASADALALYRDETREVTYQQDGTTGADVLRNDNFDIDFDAGTRLTVGRSLGDWYRIEGTYFGAFGWSDAMAVRNLDPITRPAQPGAGNLYSPFSDFGTPQGLVGVDFNTFASVEFESSFANAEINVRRRVALRSPHRLSRVSWRNEGEPVLFQHRAELSVLFGIRYVDLDDRLTYRTQSELPAGGTVNTVQIRADNEMIGPQVGFLAQFLALNPRTWVDLEGKAGIFSNDIELQSSFLRTNIAGATTASFEDVDQGDHSSFLGELTMHVNHRFTPRLTARLGYNAFWLADVALASQNLGRDIGLISSGPAQIQHRGHAVLHGPSAGIVLAY